MTLRQMLKQVRKEKKFTQQELAEAIGCGQAYISHLEGGETKTISPKIARQICEALGVPLDTFDDFYSGDAEQAVRGTGKYHLFGEVGAGRPLDYPADRGQFLTIPTHCRGADGAYRVNGQSMAGAGILSGDYLIVKRNPDPPDGSIAVAWLADHGGTVVKRVRKEGGLVYLDSVSDESLNRTDADGGQPHGIRYPHLMGDGDEVFGVLIAVFRSYQGVAEPVSPKKKGG